jgi:hypothetical protein
LSAQLASSRPTIGADPTKGTLLGKSRLSMEPYAGRKPPSSAHGQLELRAQAFAEAAEHEHDREH